MFYSIREENSCYTHSVWREEFKIADNLTFQDSFKILAANMMDYDTMQVQTVDGKWISTVWNGVEVKNHYEHLCAEETPLELDL